MTVCAIAEHLRERPYVDCRIDEPHAFGRDIDASQLPSCSLTTLLAWSDRPCCTYEPKLEPLTQEAVGASLVNGAAASA